MYIYKGSSVATRNDGSIVSFAMKENDPPPIERSNERHDYYQEQFQRNEIELAKFSRSHGRLALLQVHKKALKGSKGPSILRSLSRFDVGRSFAFDSLHNLYLGLFVSSFSFQSFLSLQLLQKRLLSLWLSSQYKNERWSVSSRVIELSSHLSCLRLPSTTTRRPRPLHKFAKYKGNEFRILLLFGYSIFENILAPEYYNHLLLLVLMAHYVSFQRH